MRFQNTSSKAAPYLALFWPACDAETVHVAFARSNWETPGVELKRQPDGGFMCILGETEPFEELLFKFIIDGTKWEVNRSLPVIVDECGYENNCWTPSEATAYHDSCVRRLRRRITLEHIDQAELCRFALSIHGQTDKDGRQLECVIDVKDQDVGKTDALKFPMSDLSSEVVSLRFQPLDRQLDIGNQEYRLGSVKAKDDSKNDGDSDKIGKLAAKPQDKDADINDIWIAKFPADLLPNFLDNCMSNPERERLMESECATIRLLNEHTKIPVPKIYAYDVRYPQTPENLPKMLPESPGIDIGDGGFVTENKVGWPYILMEKLVGMPFLPYWLLMGNSPEDGPPSVNEDSPRRKIWEQIINFQMELAKHPFSACGYLTLNCFKWQIRNETSVRKKSTPKSAFGIRPCINDTCIPFTESIVSAFEFIGDDPLYPPARAFNSIDSVTARFQHLLTHESAKNRDHFVARWQLRAMVYDIFGSRYENGPFILQHPDLSPQNIFVTESITESLVINGIIGWGGAKAVPVQVTACPPRMCIGSLSYKDNYEETRLTGLFQASVFPEEVLSNYRSEYHNCMVKFEDHMAKVGQAAISKGHWGTKIHLSQVLREEMVLPVSVFDEVCSGSMGRSLTGNIAVRYFPLIYQMVKGHKWEDVKSAVFAKGAMQMALQDWDEKQKKAVACEVASRIK